MTIPINSNRHLAMYPALDIMYWVWGPLAFMLVVSMQGCSGAVTPQKKASQRFAAVKVSSY